MLLQELCPTEPPGEAAQGGAALCFCSQAQKEPRPTAPCNQARAEAGAEAVYGERTVLLADRPDGTQFLSYPCSFCSDVLAAHPLPVSAFAYIDASYWVCSGIHWFDQG